jgi:ATP sulfurylase
MFWGCMSRHAYGPLTVVDGDMNWEKYMEILRNYALPEISASSYPLVFQQDNAPCHKNKEIIEFLGQHLPNS